MAPFPLPLTDLLGHYGAYVVYFIIGIAFGYVGGVGEVPIAAPRGTLTGDPWCTDGYRLGLWVSAEPVPIPQVGVLGWRMPYENVRPSSP